jgi:hypothetical protein
MARVLAVPAMRRRSGEGATMTGKCAACRSTFDLADLLLVVDRESGATIYVCRPRSEARCFRSAVGPAYLETITLAVPEPPLLPHVEHLAPVPQRPTAQDTRRPAP